MWTLWSLAITVAFYMGVLAQLETPPVIGSLPVDLPAVPNLAAHGSPSTQQSAPPKPSAGFTKGRCAPAAKYFLSSSKIDDYLQAVLPPQIEALVKCADLDLAGLLGTLLSTLGNADLLSTLDVTSLLDLGGGLGVSSLLGQGGDSESSGLPLLSQATSAVDDTIPKSKKAVSSLLGGNKSPLGGAIEDISLPSLQEPLGDVTEKVDAIKETTQDAIKGALPPDISSMLSGVDISELLLGLEVQGVTVDNMESSMMGNTIQVHAATTATIGGKGIAGPVISILGFKLNVDVTLHIGVSTNNTQCVNLEIQETKMESKKMIIELANMATDTLPVPLPLPMDNIIPKVLTIHLQENLEKAESCKIVLSDFSDCKNSTGTFKYQIKNAKISPEGLYVLYCVEAILGKTTKLVLGISLPPNPKDANSSLTLSRTWMKTLVDYTAKESSVKKDDLVVNITKVTYALQKNNTIQATYSVQIQKNGESFAKGKTNVTITSTGKIFKNKLKVDIKVTRTEHHVEPSEVKEEVIAVMEELFKIFLAKINELLNQANMPETVTIGSLEDTNIKLMKTNDLQAAK
ncbi:PREDICTED: vomeromodulin-like [Dipodomys ordii]|uniref:Vomeromodulin-like n=1 Tax=Dipodomys ordii TaxID=10020 RepID=A0A1S3EQE4_DIPOR|nr:PREDICTED: vomeromodulin-like [Dipodomys ordii]